MKNLLLLLVVTLLVSACSSPKYTYNFDYYNYNSGKKASPDNAITLVQPSSVVNPFALNEETLLASSDEKAVVLTELKNENTETAAQALSKKYRAMNKVEKREFRHAVKQQMKNYVKAKKSGDHVAMDKATKAMDNDLKLAIIFGAVGLTLSLFGGANQAFWVLSVIAIVIAVVFFVKWIVRQ